MQPIWTQSVNKCEGKRNGQTRMNTTDKQVTFGTIKRTRMRNTNDLSAAQQGLRQT